MYGARLSLLVGCLVVVLSLIMGVVLGLLAGYFGGAVDAVIMRVVDIMLALPSLLLALVLVAVFGPSIVNASLALTFRAAALCASDACSGAGGSEPRLRHRFAGGGRRRAAPDVRQHSA